MLYQTSPDKFIRLANISICLGYFSGRISTAHLGLIGIEIESFWRLFFNFRLNYYLPFYWLVDQRGIGWIKLFLISSGIYYFREI